MSLKQRIKKLKHLAHGEQVKSKYCQNWIYVNWHSPKITLQGSKQMQIIIEGKNINQAEKGKSLGVLILMTIWPGKATKTKFLKDIFWPNGAL